MEQKWADFPASEPMVSSCMARAVTGSSARLNWSFQRNLGGFRSASFLNQSGAFDGLQPSKGMSGRFPDEISLSDLWGLPGQLVPGRPR